MHIKNIVKGLASNGMIILQIAGMTGISEEEVAVILK